MHIISRKALTEFAKQHPGAEEVLNDWYRKAKRIGPKDLAELRQTFASADIFGDCVVFNVGGNNYRVIAYVHFRGQRLFIRAVLTHAEYDRDRWKRDC